MTMGDGCDQPESSLTAPPQSRHFGVDPSFIDKHDFTNPVAWSKNLTDIGHYIKGYQRLMAHWRESIRDRFLEFEYESLVADPETYMSELIAFLGLQWEPACMDFHQTSGEVHTVSTRQVREPINDRSFGRWKNYQDLLAPMTLVLYAENSR
jgi:hypothetical protein